MSKLNKQETSSIIHQAICAKRDSRSSIAADIAQMEEALMADLESFDIDAAVAQASREHVSHSGAGMLNVSLEFPEIAAASREFHQAHKIPKPVAAMPTTAQKEHGETDLLAQLRQEAANKQRAMHSALANRNAINDSVDKALKQVFSFLHELVEQLNIVKPAIARKYHLIDKHEFSELLWQEGFADYRTQSESAGALTELVSFSYQLNGARNFCIERDGPLVERFRTLLFDYGLQFSCNEFRNDRRYVERAIFDIQSKLSVNARWRADYANGRIILETRNLERLGSIPYHISPERIDQVMLNEFGRLVLGQPNHFRDRLRHKI